MKVGIRDGMLGLRFEEVFGKAKEVGFDGVEICIGANYREHPLWSESGVDDIKALSEAAGIETPALSPGGFTAYTFAHPDDATRAEGIAMLQHLSAVCPKLGAGVILVPFFGDGKIETEHITSPRLIDGVKAAAAAAEQHNVCLALESTLTAAEHQQILDQVGSPAVGVYYDMGNATGFGYDAAQEIRQLGNAIAQMHIKDTAGSHAGEGGVDFPAVIEATHAIGYNGWFVLETPANDDPIASAVKNLNFVQEKLLRFPTNERDMSVSSKLINPHLEAEKLLKMPVTTAEVLFQGYTIDQQLELISSVRDAKAREELYYLVPDCTELIQMSPAEDVLQILDTRLGTGTASALLPCLSSDQFEEIMDFVLWRNGELDEKTLDLWLFELSECEVDELGEMLSQIDVGILGGLLRGRVEMDEEFKALFIEEGLVDPSTPGIDYSDERAKAIIDAIWEADADLFVRVLYELFGLDREDELGEELWGALDRAKEEQEERVRERDKAAGIDITEAEILEKVDLDQLDLEDKERSEADEESEDA